MGWYSDFALNEMGSFESQDVDRCGRSLHEGEKLYVCRKIQSVGRLGSFFGNAAGCAPREKVALAGNSREGLGSGAGGASKARDTFFMATEADCHGASSGTPILHLYQVPNAQLASEMRQMVERRGPD